MLKEVLSMSERLACKAVGLARSTYRRIPLAQTPADPDADLREWLRTYATTNPCHGFRRAWAALRLNEHQGVNNGKSVKIDEHTCKSLLTVVERSITAERLICELEGCFVFRGGDQAHRKSPVMLIEIPHLGAVGL